MSKRFLMSLLVIFLIFGGIFWAKRDKAGSPSNGSSGEVTATNHIYGEGAKGVTLLEYGDYQCSACYSYYGVIKTLVEEYKEDIYFQYRNFPLVQIHQNALAGARAAEAADKQGKFWEMHSKLYENQDPSGQSGWVASNSPLTFFTEYANDLNLNIDQFNADYNSAEINDIINADTKEARSLGLSSTPTFFLNGEEIKEPPLPNNQSGWKELIEKAIADKSQDQ